MSASSDTAVVIVGGGPIGLFLGCALAIRGISCRIVEKRQEVFPHSRAIGIHPPALHALAGIGLADRFVSAGIAIRRAQGYFGSRRIAGMDFGRVLRPPFDFVLAIPQRLTESLLEERLKELAPNALLRNATFTGYAEEAGGVCVDYMQAGEWRRISTRFLVGCDGGDSPVRERAGIRFPNESFPDRYVMGDFTDDSPFLEDAALFLSSRGIVESFPLPEGLRRWVVHTGISKAGKQGPSGKDATPSNLSAEIEQRTGFPLVPDTCTMLSSFGVRNGCADRLVAGRVALAGDAAHICSPMGGQGMNLGFLGATDLARSLQEALADDRAGAGFLAEYDRTQRRRARTVTGRAAFNTRLGRGRPGVIFQALGFATLLHLPAIHDRFARQFTMQAL